MNPVVSVYITTYFHEKYIAQAIESVLSQKTSFDYEIVISDDCSEDGTARIIKDYEEKYDFIHVNINKKNIGISRNMLLAKKMCKGKYITSLDGDDRYIDDFKLQKQYDFLEKNIEYFAVGCGLKQVDLKSGNSVCFPNKKETNKEFTLQMFLDGKDINNNGLMYRNPFLSKEGDNYFSIMPTISSFIDDLTDEFLVLNYGRVYVSNDICVEYKYRDDENNYNSINKGLDSYIKHIELLNNLYVYFDGKYNLKRRYEIILLSGIKKAIISRDFTKFLSVYYTIPKEYINGRVLITTILFFAPKKVFYKLKNYF